VVLLLDRRRWAARSLAGVDRDDSSEIDRVDGCWCIGRGRDFETASSSLLSFVTGAVVSEIELYWDFFPVPGTTSCSSIPLE